MVNLPSKVTPGDVITSELMNAFLEEFASLKTRVVELEEATPTDGKMSIILPKPSDIYQLGDELKIVGKNFSEPSQNTVFIDDTVQVNQFKAGSNNELLIIDIPFVRNISENGRSVMLKVSNPKDFASSSFILKRRVVTKPTGTLTVTLVQSPSEPKLEAGKDYIFIYRITAITTLDETYLLDPNVDLGWQAQVVDNSDNPVQPEEIFIPKAESGANPSVVNLRVKVKIPSGTATDTIGKLKLDSTSKRNPSELFGSSEESELKVGGQPPAGDKVEVKLSGVFSPGKMENNDIIIPATNTDIGATFTAIVSVQGNYDIENPPTFNNDPQSLWSAYIVPPYTGVPMQPNQSSLFSIAIKAKPGATATTMIVKVVKQGDPSNVGDLNQVVRTS